MKDIKWLKYYIENTQNSPYCAQATIIKQLNELQPYDLNEIAKMGDDRPRVPTFEELMEADKNGK